MDAPTVLQRLEHVGVVPRAAEVIHGLRERFPDLLVGAGTVLNASTAKAAIDEGAQFLVSAIAPPDAIAYGRQRGIAVIPGALFPAEVLSAVTLGADVVKLFPASLRGPGYLRALHEPFPFLRLFPTGGISAANVHEWFAVRALELMRAVMRAREKAG